MILKSKHLHVPRINSAHVDYVIVDTTYTKLPSGRNMICEHTLTNGSIVTGKYSVSAPEHFNVDVGRSISCNAARNKIWELEEYLFQQYAHEGSQSDRV